MTDLNKDLLQEVIGKEYKILKITKHSITVIHEEAFNSVEWCEHKVAHKCKEWAKSQKLFILSLPSPNEGLEGYWANLTNNTHRAFAATEPEAIFKATSYIMEQLKQKD